MSNAAPNLASRQRSNEDANPPAPRLAHEAELIAEAERAVAAGDYIADEDMDAWLDAWVEGTDADKG